MYASHPHEPTIDDCMLRCSSSLCKPLARRVGASELFAGCPCAGIYGSQADPKKMKLLRLMMRARSACADCDFSEPALTNFTRLLLKPTEHTFGLHGLGGEASDCWDNADLEAALTSHDNDTAVGQLGSKLRQWTASWVEQRLYPDYALAALAAPHASPTAKALGAAIAKEMQEQWPVSPPSVSGFAKVAAGKWQR